MPLKHHLITIFVFSAMSILARGERPVVKTNYGKIRGHILTSYKGKTFYAFNGIPYAKPPVGDLRFRPPVSPSRYDGILDASIDGDDCFQANFNGYNQYSTGNQYVGSEDCLYLNVYTPNLSGSNLPVMVFIHGGAFKVGSGASNLQGPQFFMDNDIVLVTINYRLEILGFLRADDTHLPGNLGIRDQSAALLWVKGNIHHFSGDRDSITIFGESAGGASVHFQMIAPRNKGLFNRAISQSGSIHCFWAIQSLTKAKELAETLAATTGCPNEPQQMLKCLQEKSVLELYQAYSTFDLESPYYMHFKPVFENEVPGAFITKRSFEKGSNKPWIIGINSGEGIMFLDEIISNGDPNLSELNQSYQELLPTMIYLKDNPRSRRLVENIKHFYLGEKNFSMDSPQNTVDLLSDAMFSYGFHLSSRNHHGKLYKYLYSHVGERSFAHNLLNLNLGANHGDELHLQFYSTQFYTTAELGETDSRVSLQLLTLWTNFAKHGVPTPEGSEGIWPDSSGSSEYLEISTEGLKLGSNLYKERFEFWESLDEANHQSIKDERTCNSGIKNK